jgi:hypothetical protein
LLVILLDSLRLQAWADSAILFISLLSHLYSRESSSESVTAAALCRAGGTADSEDPAAPLKLALFSFLSRIIDVSSARCACYE